MNWLRRLEQLAFQNRPSRKPQLWEDFPLAVRRRVALEVGQRLDPGWLDRPRVVALSRRGFGGEGLPPLRMELVPREEINRALFLYGSFEISETRLIQLLLAPGMTFLDVGANIGYYTLVGARAVGPRGVVHAFEPNDRLRGRLEENLRRNDLANVVVHGEALAAETGTVRFYASTLEGNQGISSILPGEGRAEVAAVPSVSLDDLAGRLGDRRIDLIKMDVEGAEPAVIAGGARVLAARDAPPVIFEARDLAPLAGPLRAYGYHVRRIDYSLAHGLELPSPEAPNDSPFADYEAPNYVAAKDPTVFDTVIARSGAQRSIGHRLLGRL